VAVKEAIPRGRVKKVTSAKAVVGPHRPRKRPRDERQQRSVDSQCSSYPDNNNELRWNPNLRTLFANSRAKNFMKIISLAECCKMR